MSRIRNLFAISVPSFLACILGCGQSENSVQSDDEINVEPIKAAFDESEIGPSIDWKSLGGADKDFLLALWDRDSTKVRAALAAGANARLNCGHGCNALMLAAAMGDAELVESLKKAGVSETPDAEPYMEILNFEKNAQCPAYNAALKEIERLSGVKPVPTERRGVYSIDLNSQAANALLEKHHERLLNNGCYVFLYDQNFSIRGKPDVLWIVPTQDKFAVMAFIGVSGINYDIDNYLVIKWMKKLDKDHPYLLNGCGLDFLSGRFKARLSDVNAMAKRMYAFCPDIVDQGTGSVAALAEDLKKANQLYFWWD
jgi:hypothetical protein